MTFNLYILKEYLPLTSSAILEDILSKEVLVSCMDVLSTNKNKRKKKMELDGASMWKGIFEECDTDQCFGLYKLMTKYIPSILNHIVMKNVWDKLSLESKQEYIVYLQGLITTSIQNKSLESIPTYIDVLYHIPSSTKNDLSAIYKPIISFFMSLAYEIQHPYQKISSSRFYSLLSNYMKQMTFISVKHQMTTSQQVDVVHGILNDVFMTFYNDVEKYKHCIHEEYQGKLKEILQVVVNLNGLLNKNKDYKVVIQSCLNLVYFLLL